MFRKGAIFVILLLSAFLSYSQQDITGSETVVDIIKKQLTEPDLKKLEIIEEDDQKALNSLSEINKQYEELNKKKQEIDNEKNPKVRDRLLKKSLKMENKIVRSHVKILEDIGSLYVRRHLLYKKDIHRLLASYTGDSRTEIEELVKMANDCNENAGLLEQKIAYTDNQYELFKIFDRSHKIKQLGILYQEKVYANMLDADASVKDSIDKKIEALKSALPDESAQKDEDDEITSHKKDSIITIKEVVHDTIFVEQTIQNPVLYKVQIAAARKPMDIVELKRIFTNGYAVQCEIENNWYKYSVGFFFSYNEAKNYKMRSGIKDAFIIAYLNEKKIPIPDLVNHPSYMK